MKYTLLLSWSNLHRIGFSLLLQPGLEVKHFNTRRRVSRGAAGAGRQSAAVGSRCYHRSALILAGAGTVSDAVLWYDASCNCSNLLPLLRFLFPSPLSPSLPPPPPPPLFLLSSAPPFCLSLCPSASPASPLRLSLFSLTPFRTTLISTPLLAMCTSRLLRH